MLRNDITILKILPLEYENIVTYHFFFLHNNSVGDIVV